MKILIVTDGVYPFSMGGSHRLIYELAVMLEKKGHQVVCIVPEIDATVHIGHSGAQWLDRDGFRIIRFSSKRRGLIGKCSKLFSGYLSAVNDFLEREKVDVINVHYIPALFALRKLAKEHPILYTFHGPWSGEFRQSFSGRMDGRSLVHRVISSLLIEPVIEGLGSILERKCLSGCLRFMCISSYMRNLLTSNFGIKVDKVSVIPSGVNGITFFPEADLPFRERISQGKKHVFLTVRRLEKRMGLDILVRACALLKQEYPDFILLIGGKGIQFDYLQSLINATGCSDNVRMMGFVPEAELRKYLSAADLFILPSRDLEGFGLVVLEAMACGTPVLVSPKGGPREVVEEFDPRFILPNLNADAISRKILELVDSGILLDQDTKDKCEALAGNYSWDRFADSYLDWVGKNDGNNLNKR